MKVSVTTGLENYMYAPAFVTGTNAAQEIQVNGQPAMLFEGGYDANHTWDPTLKMVNVLQRRGMLVYWLILLMYQALEYTRVIKEEEVRASMLKTQLAEAHLQTLKTQLQPHFLFNTLHSISELIHEDVEAADTMIARLGDSDVDVASAAAVALDSGFTSAVLQRMALAFAGNDAPTINVLNGLLAKRSARIPERDRLDWESRVKFIAGDLERSEQLALLLLQRYPRDPRSYELLQLIYENLGRWDAQQSVLERLLALDSLGMEAGHGLCMPCLAFGNLTTARLNSPQCQSLWRLALSM